MSVGIPFRVLWRALKGYYEELFPLLGANLVWLVCLAIPFSLGTLALRYVSNAAGVIIAAVLLAAIMPPASAGMLYLTNRVAHEKPIEFSMFFEGAKKYAGKSYLWLLMNIAVAVIIGSNIWFYGLPMFMEQQWATIIRGIFVGLGVMWLLIQIYFFPMLLEQEEPKLRLALRNAAFLAFASPITTLVLAVLMVLVAALCIGTTLPFAVAMAAVLGLMANGAVLTLLVHFKIRKSPEEEEDEAEADA